MTIIGSARFNYFIWEIYQATLYAQSPDFSFPDTRPYALAIKYNRTFTKQQLLDETERQWLNLEELSDRHNSWLDQLASIWMDVSAGDTLTLYVDQSGHSFFYFNGNLLGTISESDFGREFGGIWLSDTTSRPDFRRKLLGE